MRRVQRTQDLDHLLKEIKAQKDYVDELVVELRRGRQVLRTLLNKAYDQTTGQIIADELGVTRQRIHQMLD